MENETTYLRPSGINTFRECGAKYMFQFVENVHAPNKIHLAFGNSIHKANEVNFSQKVETKTDLPTEEVKQIFSDVFDNELCEVDKNDFTLINPGQMKDGGLKLIEHYQKFYAPRIQPIAVEQRIKVTFKNYDYGLSCKIDVFDQDGIIIDHKSTKKKVNGTVPEDYQLQVGGAYVIAEEATQRKVTGARIDYFDWVRNEFHPIAIPIDKEYFMNIFQITGDAIKAGIFMPNRKSFFCSKRYCKFYAECEKKFGGTVKP